VSDSSIVRAHVRRRTRRHRRNRLLRRSLLAAVFVMGGLTGAALLPFDFGSYLASSFSSNPAQEWSNSDVHRDLALSAAGDSDASQPSRQAHPVYPYSIVPGGVHDPKELEQAFERDPVVAAHYRGFDFRRARVVELNQDKAVYVSYRIAGHVYWTTKLVHLRRGEKVITDGKMTLRTRCGNQVSETARQEVSPKEPTVARMEQPMNDGGSATAIPIPADFDSALARPNLTSFGPAVPGHGYIANNGGLLSLYPPPLPTCNPGKKGKAGSGPTPGATTGKKKNSGGCNSPPAEVPEPGTWLLLSTGLAGAYLRYRKNTPAA
jgi:PEP-CTERM motif